MNFPLYVYAPGRLALEKRVNFHKDVFEKLKRLSSRPDRGEPSERDVFDYVYGILHCTDYRTEYREFLKIDFPSIPWPPSPDVFWTVADKGSLLRRLHLMEPQAVGQTPYQFSGDGDGTVRKPDYRDGKIWINETQYFDKAPEVSWRLHIGGYQPARKWLKDRKGQALSFDDILHYQKVIKILAETDRIMGTIEMRSAPPAAA